MKEFSKKIILFFLPIFLLTVILEVMLREMPNDYKIKSEHLTSNASDIEILILGSSHSFYGLNPEYFDSKTYNAGFLSQTLKYDLEILEKYQPGMRKLEYVILPISYFTLLDNMEDKSKWRISYYVNFHDIPAYSIFDYSLLLSNKLDVNIRLLKRNYIEDDPKLLSSKSGWADTFYGTVNADLNESAQEAVSRHTITNDQYLKENIKILNKIITFCRNNEINLILFTPPASKSYVELLDKDQLSMTVDTVMAITKSYDHVTFQNWINNKSFSSSDFYDADHLNKKGSKKLTLMVKDMIESNDSWGQATSKLRIIKSEED